ncbi:MAG: superoxide dismutase [Candidatus Hydrogenedentota bacterium]|nr:MAG: superoxide dismutase [Candidatus Hydrogenedentota bacterium]
MSAPFSLPKLPYADDALAPVISANTIGFHYGKHHNAYVNNLNKLVEGTEYADMSLEDIFQKTFQQPDKVGIFNNAAQVWNHTFYWNSLSPNGGGKPSGKIAELVEKAFGSTDKFLEEFSKAAATQFGSGWAWVVQEGDSISVMKTPNAENPIVHGKKPLLTIDVWEHAYYLDYQNRRPDYIKAVLEKLINWEFANQNLG